MGYICAFRGRRDSYQLPLALEEAGKLDRFITDHYFGLPEKIVAGLLPSRFAEAAQNRFEAGLSQRRVLSLRITAALKSGFRRIGMSPADVYERFDARYGKVAIREARRLKSDLFLYSSYAWEAFNATYAHAPRKILFQYHPHYALENEILRGDRTASQEMGICFSDTFESSALKPDGMRKRSDQAWQLADAIVCASGFTKRSLVEAGANPDWISVVPYGIPPIIVPEEGDLKNGDSVFEVLFVGSGLQRKGLHHLLLAWQRARLPPGSRLTVVARVINSGLSTLIEKTPNVRYIQGVTKAELWALYRSSTLFAMPSLVEGFGQVYLEALSSGLPVLGTPNTCCPELGEERHGVFIVPPAEPDLLAAKLNSLAQQLPGNELIRRNARLRSQQFGWENFRSRLRDIVQAI